MKRSFKHALLAGAVMVALAGSPMVVTVHAQSTQSMPYSIASVQRTLNELGYAAGPVDGLMGSRSRGAIRAYQADNRLPVSGEPSLSLYENLQGTHARRFGEATTPAASSPAIAEIQSLLRQRGYDVPEMTGTLDARTGAAIRSYQADAGLPVTGTASSSLLANLRIGTGGNASNALTRVQVAQLQGELSERGYDPGPRDGIVGPKVRTAIRTYQTDAGLPGTGEATASLLAHIQSPVQDDVEDNEDDVTGDGATVDRALTRMESELQRHLYYVGEVDGEVDDQTVAAIRAYQRDAGLPVTGRPTPDLLRHLEASSVRNRSETTSLLVWEIENELARRDFYVGEIDGTVDPQARTAIKIYQRMAGIDHNGKPSYPLLQHIEGSTVRNNTQSASLLIWRVEDELSRRGYATGAVDGTVDAQTTEAVRRYQEDAGRTITGKADGDLLADFERSDPRQISEREIREIERRLERRKYVTGPVDGVADSQTAAAIRAYQTDAQLPVTGRPSIALLQHLRSSNVRAAGDTEVEEAIREVIESFVDAGN
jgi:peptidoglycan hydrolase-like protein with peptidoglycan-binding domain